jgi:hypothetical protein
MFFDTTLRGLLTLRIGSSAEIGGITRPTRCDLPEAGICRGFLDVWLYYRDESIAALSILRIRPVLPIVRDTPIGMKLPHEVIFLDF